MNFRRAIVSLTLCAAPLPVSAVLITNLNDDLNDASHFIASELDLVNNGNGTVSLVHTNASPPNDQTALWGIDGANVHLALGGSVFSLLASGPTISGTTTGQWGFDVLWFDNLDNYLGQTTYQGATNAIGLQVYNITSSVPVGAVGWTPQFRVFDQDGNQPLVAGYGFTFDRLHAYAVPEPNVLGLGLIGGAIAFNVARRRKRSQV